MFTLDNLYNQGTDRCLIVVVVVVAYVCSRTRTTTGHGVRIIESTRRERHNNIRPDTTPMRDVPVGHIN